VAEDWLGKWALNPDADQGLDPRVRPSVAVAEIGQRLGWLPQTVRAAITGLRQAGRAKELTTIIDLETGARGVHAFPRGSLDRIIESNPRLAVLFCRQIIADEARAHDHLTNLPLRSAKERIAQFMRASCSNRGGAVNII